MENLVRTRHALISFSKFVPLELVQHLLHKQREAKLGVSPRELSIFFSDIEGFTTLAEVAFRLPCPVKL